MAFTSVLDPAEVFPDFEIDGGTVSMITAIGFDPEAGASYSLFVSLSAMPGTSEVTFCIIELEDEFGAPHDIYSGLQTQRFLQDRQLRANVLLHAAAAAAAMVKSEKPDQVSFCTFDADMPKKALAKYEYMAEHIALIGYDIERPPPHGGHRAWILHRRAP